MPVNPTHPAQPHPPRGAVGQAGSAGAAPADGTAGRGGGAASGAVGRGLGLLLRRGQREVVKSVWAGNAGLSLVGDGADAEEAEGLAG
eukprot:15457636-Alexandrium_andersonii.AAC.1